jgi:hypothetical protein
LSFRHFALLAAIAAAVPAAALAGDPFDDARYAIGIKQNDTALALVDQGKVDVNMQNAEGYTLLHYAADAGNLEMVKALLARGANPAIKSAVGSTPYDMAMSTTVKAVLKAAMPATPPAAAAVKPASAPARASAPAPAAKQQSAQAKDCQKKWYADQALASDSTGKMAAYRRWQQCLKTGRYW